MVPEILFDRLYIAAECQSAHTRRRGAQGWPGRWANRPANRATTIPRCLCQTARLSTSVLAPNASPPRTALYTEGRQILYKYGVKPDDTRATENISSLLDPFLPLSSTFPALPRKTHFRLNMTVLSGGSSPHRTVTPEFYLQLLTSHLLVAELNPFIRRVHVWSGAEQLKPFCPGMLACFYHACGWA